MVAFSVWETEELPPGPCRINSTSTRMQHSEKRVPPVNAVLLLQNLVSFATFAATIA
jgi:hypothetical protein